MRFLFLLLFIFFAASCINKDKVPDGVIVRDSMPRLLWDVIVADQYSKQYLLKDSSKTNTRLETMKLYQQVFQIHHTTRDQFEKSYQYYISRPDLMKIIFDSLSVYSNKQRTEIYKPIKPKIVFKAQAK
jgi:hypothetical protein